MSESGRIGNSRSGPGIWRNPAWNRDPRQDVEISRRNPVSSPDFPPEPRFGLDFLMESDFSSQISRRKVHFSRQKVTFFGRVIRTADKSGTFRPKNFRDVQVRAI